MSSEGQGGSTASDDPLAALGADRSASRGELHRQDALRAALFPDLAPPPRIGRFVVDGILGSGAMGTVFAAHDDRLDRKVAIKLLRDASRGAGRLLREARGLARISHPNVVTVFEVGEHAGQPFIAMEHVAGSTLREWAVGRTPGEILAAYRAAGEGLAAVHAAGLVHRDFKPANVLMGLDGIARLADFGLVRAADDEVEAGRGALPADPTLTATGAVLGTPAYMAPEQRAAQPVGPAADQYAFCAALYEALVGERPFGTAAEATGEPPRRSLPRAWHAALARGLAPRPADRWPGMQPLIAALAPRRRRWPWVALVALALMGWGLWPAAAPDIARPRSTDGAIAHARALLDTDPTHAGLVLRAIAPDHPEWRRLAWEALRQPMTRDVVPPPGPESWVPRLGLSRDGVPLRFGGEDTVQALDAGRWRRLPLTLEVRPMMLLSAFDLRDDAGVRLLDGLAGELLDRSITTHCAPGDTLAFCFIEAGWLFGWWGGAIEPIGPYPWPRTLAANSSAGRLVANGPGEPVWIVPLDGTAPRPIPDTEDVLTADSAPAHDALLMGDGRIVVVPADGAPQILDRLTRPAQILRLSPDGAWLASTDGASRIWRIDRAAPAFTPVGAARSRAMAFSRDSRRALFIPDGTTLVEVHLESHRQRTLRGHPIEPVGLAPTADGGWASIDRAGVTRLWRIRDAEVFGRLPERLWWAGLAPDGAHVLATGSGGWIGRFPLDGGPPRFWRHPPEAGRTINVFRARALGADRIVSGGADGTARIWDLASDAPQQTLAGHAVWAYALAVSPDGRWIATGDRDGAVRLWASAGGDRPVRTWPPRFPSSNLRVHTMGFLADSSAVVWAQRDGAALLARVDQDAPQILTPAAARIVFAPDGAFATHGARTVGLFDARGRPLRQIELAERAASVQFSRDGARFAVATTDRRLLIFPRNADAPIRTIGPLEGVVEFMVFSPDGAEIAFGLPDGAVTIASVEREEIWPVGEHTGAIRGVIWPRPDTLVTAGAHGELLRWPVDRRPAALKARLEAATSLKLDALQRRRWLGTE